MRISKKLSIALACAAGALSPLMNVNIAQADPAGFPDLSQFPAEDAFGHYALRMRPDHYTIAFLSPNRDFNCAFAAHPNSNGFSGFSCGGNIPGTDSVPVSEEALPSPCARVLLSAGEDGGSIEKQDPKCSENQLFGVPLLPGHRVVDESVTCGATSTVIMACINEDTQHGFVISRAQTWTF